MSDQSTDLHLSFTAAETVEPPFVPTLGGDSTGVTPQQIRQQAFALYMQFAKNYMFRLITVNPANGADKPSTYKPGASDTQTFLVFNTNTGVPFMYNPVSNTWINLLQTSLTNTAVVSAYNSGVAAASAFEMQTGTVTAIRRMSPLNVAQAIAALAPTGAKTNSTTVDPGVTDDVSKGYAVNSIWTNRTSDASFICADSTTGSAVWRNITNVVGSINSDTIVEGTTNLFVTASQRTAISSLGTASTFAVPPTGDASATQLVRGNDTRLTNARTPTTHGHTGAEITNLGTYTGTTVPDNATLPQAIQALELAVEAASGAGVKNNLAGGRAPLATDDSGSGYARLSVWFDTSANPVESYRCHSATVGAAVWAKTTLTADELHASALSGNSDDVVQGSINLFATTAEKALWNSLASRSNHTGTQTLSTISDAGTAAAATLGTGSGQVPTVEPSGKLPASIIPSVSSGNLLFADNASDSDFTTVTAGKVVYRADENKFYEPNTGATAWTAIDTGGALIYAVNASDPNFTTVQSGKVVFRQDELQFYYTTNGTAWTSYSNDNILLAANATHSNWTTTPPNNKLLIRSDQGLVYYPGTTSWLPLQQFLVAANATDTRWTSGPPDFDAVLFRADEKKLYSKGSVKGDVSTVTADTFAQTGGPMKFTNNGNTIYLLDDFTSTNLQLVRFNPSTSYNADTKGTEVGRVDLTATPGSPPALHGATSYHFYLNPTEDKLYVQHTSTSNPGLYQWNFGTAGDVTTLTYVGVRPYTHTGNEVGPAYVLNEQCNKLIYQQNGGIVSFYDMPTGDVGSVTQISSISYSTLANTTNSVFVFESDDGKTLLESNGNTSISRISFATAGDLNSTRVTTANILTLPTAPNVLLGGLFWSNQQGILYFLNGYTETDTHFYFASNIISWTELPLGGSTSASEFNHVLLNTGNSTSITAANRDHILVTTTAASTVNPPATPTAKMVFRVTDASSNAATNKITVNFTAAGQKLHSTTSVFEINLNKGTAEFEYVNATIGWVIK